MLWIIGFIISALLLVWAFHGINLEPLFQTLASLTLWPIPLMLICIFLYFFFRCLRWQLLLSPVKKIPISSLAPSLVLGTASGYLTFGYIGELARIFLLSQKVPIKKMSILTSILMERLFDLWTLLLIFSITTIFSPAIWYLANKWGYLGLAITGFLTIFAVFVVFLPETSLNIFQKLLHPFPSKWHGRIMEEIDAGIQGFSSIARPRLVLGIILTSILEWVFMCGCNWLAVICINIYVPPWAMLEPMLLTIFGMTLPSSPGQLGIIEISYVLGLNIWGVTQENALAAGILYHIVLYSSVVITACILAKTQKISLSSVRNLIKKRE